uniref:IRS-type PTB domain-containing protein n=1 Tax=Strongyloides stercoralis TaxID=6248 RepID=A0A0K0DT05_STRER
MGNCVSADNRKFLEQINKNENNSLSGRYSEFKVFVKQNKKFIPGTLRIGPNEILFIRNKDNIQVWPLNYLRRYGYTCANIFFFECGRRCSSGEGLFTFQSSQSEIIFQLIQQKIQQNYESQRNSRASSIVGNLQKSSTYSISNVQSLRGIQPVQRFCSEGTTKNDYLYPHSTYGENFCYDSCKNEYLFNRLPYTNYYKDRPKSIATSVSHNLRSSPFHPKGSFYVPSKNKLSSSMKNFNSISLLENHILQDDIINEHIISPPNQMSNLTYERKNFYEGNFLPDNKKKYHSYVNVSMLENNDYLFSNIDNVCNGNSLYCEKLDNSAFRYTSNEQSHLPIILPYMYQSSISNSSNTTTRHDLDKIKEVIMPLPTSKRLYNTSNNNTVMKNDSISQKRTSTFGNICLNYALIDIDTSNNEDKRKSNTQINSII